MAEVHRARRRGVGGFEKVFALKRILPALGRDPSLVARFLEEARISARLDHSNLIHVVDFGSEAGELYLVMELVDGPSLFAILRKLSEGGRAPPPEVAAYVVAEIAAGLSHAHGLRDREDRPLDLVHRDVAPQNILLSRHGDAKLGDFGIAKVVGSPLRTATGVLLGRVSHMSPEHARNETLDARSDIYSLGIVLWECLVGRPLFPRGIDEDALKAIMDPKVPPPSSVAAVPAALDEIVMRALAPDRFRRTPTAAALSRELRRWLHGAASGFGPPDLAAFVSSVDAGAPSPDPSAPGSVPRTSETRRERPQPPRVHETAPTMPERPPPPVVTPPEDLAGRAAPPADPIDLSEEAAGTSAPDLAPPAVSPGESRRPASPATPAERPRPLGMPPRARWPTVVSAALLAALGSLAAVGASLGLFDARRIPDEPPRGEPVWVETEPPGAQVITEQGVVGVTPTTVFAPKRLALMLATWAPVVVPDPAETLATGPVHLVRAKGDWAVLEIDCPQRGRVVFGGRDVGPAPVLVVVELVRGAPTSTAYIRSAGGRVPVNLVRVSGHPWSLVRIGPGTGCPPAR